MEKAFDERKQERMVPELGTTTLLWQASEKLLYITWFSEKSRQSYGR